MNKMKKQQHKTPFHYIVSVLHYLKQALDVHLLYHAIHATSHMILDTGLIIIFELIQIIIASFSN